MTDPSIDIRRFDSGREVRITTVGRNSGRRHAVVVWWAAGSERTAFVMAGYGRRTDWARNALARGEAGVDINGRRFTAVPRVAEGAEHDRAARLLARKYDPYPGEWENGYILALDLSAT
jgi:deazaflavin-dependent oxidoreductase (nitroreductase family)